jgi:uncharacterized protein (TIGR02145 family)
LAYINQEELVQYYGRMYRWVDVMKGQQSSNTNPSNVQGICPCGWHVPSNAEWQQLIAYLGGSAVAGGKMKATGTQFWAEPNEGATNSSGFNGRGSGFYNTIDGFANLWYDAIFWSSTLVNSNSAYFIALRYDVPTAYNPTSGLGITTGNRSVRCVKD